MNNTVFLNGRFLDHSEAKISADDRGFHFADGVYEVVKYYNGKPFRLEDHFQRLDNSVKEVRINSGETYNWTEIFYTLLYSNDLLQQDAGIYLQISRGASQRIHQFPPNLAPTVYAFAFPFPSFGEKLEYGIKVILREDIRWLRCDIKSVCLLPNSMLYTEALEKGAFECIMARNGLITEATHSSVLGVKKGEIYTHPLSNLILPGITRKVLIEIAMKEGIAVREEAIAANQLGTLDELIICGTGSEVLPAVQVDNLLIGSGKPGPVTRLLQKKFFELAGK